MNDAIGFCKFSNLFFREVIFMADTFVQKAPETDPAQLFTMKQTAAATGLSRSTILRMEDRGFLKPAYVSPTSGNRYYDVYNVSRILSVQQLVELGFTNDEARQYFSAGADAAELFALVERRLEMLQRTYEEMKLRATTDKHLSVQLCRIGEGWFYVERHAEGLTLQDKYNANYNAHRHCIEKGIRLGLGSQMCVNHRTDYLEGRISGAPYPFDSYVPVHPGQDAPEIVRESACTALVLYYCGELSELDDAYLRLGREVRERDLKSAGYVRVEGIVGPPIGRDVDMDQYRCRLILPVEG